ncbi:MAG: hypothetical protein LBC18_02800 [Opitutaceae bacterium]|jgi:hypothetical protein|nr:hypothetical protein [Opitutaceae bacterium]
MHAPGQDHLGDGGYAGKLIAWAKNGLATGWKLEIVKRTGSRTFKILPKHWIVERAFGWMMFWQIMNRHHERKYDTAENIMQIIMIKPCSEYFPQKISPPDNLPTGFEG